MFPFELVIVLSKVLRVLARVARVAFVILLHFTPLAQGFLDPSRLSIRILNIEPGKCLNLLSKLNRVLLILNPRRLWLFLDIILRERIEQLDIEPRADLRRLDFRIG